MITNVLTVSRINPVLSNTPDNTAIIDTLVKANSVLSQFDNILVSVSGGSDSDIMLDIFQKLRTTQTINYVFFDTGLEYEASKKHLTYLENNYGIHIDVIRPATPCPLACKQYGVPFLSKTISTNIQRLQSHGFQWEDESFAVLWKRYPKCKSALRWWSNEWGENSNFNISRNKLLKAFIMRNPPPSISPKCCDYGKKAPAKIADKKYKPQLKVMGIRRSESGARSTAYKNCFSAGDISEYRPLFWWADADKQIYKEHYGIQYSDCYEKYGLSRTGCAGCPYGSGFENELQVIDTYEPRLSVAVTNVFGAAYEYTRKYREFKANYKRLED